LEKDGNFVTSVDACWVRENQFFDNYFLMSLLLYTPNQRKLLNLSSGSGRVRISKKNLFGKFVFRLPCYSEQQKIADFLSSIDQKINLVTTEFDHAKTFKKGLLQQMFI
jgi:type I restriction enzyme S subunit